MWYYEQNGQALGPVNTDNLAILVSSGVIQPQTQVCREGESTWNPAYQTELASLFSKTALSWVNNPTPDEPPLPGQASVHHTPSNNRPGRAGLSYELSGMTTALKILLSVGALFAFVAIMSHWSEYDLISDIGAGVFPTEEAAGQAAAENDVRQFMIGLTQLLLFIGTGIVFLIWIYRACSNARSLTERSMKYTPGWAVGWYFIPIANLYKPYEAMKEIFELSTRSRFGRSKSTAIVGVWWMLWIITNGVSNVVGSYYQNATGLEAMKTANLVAMFGNGLDIVLAVVAIMLIGQIIEGQQGRSHHTPTMQPQPVA